MVGGDFSASLHKEVLSSFGEHEQEALPAEQDTQPIIHSAYHSCS